MHRFTLVIILALAATASSPAQVLRVPSQHATIGAALAAATAGCTILVAPGTYHETLTWPVLDGIRLISEGGPAVTKIDARQAGRVLTFSAPLSTRTISRSTLVSGFEITGGLLTGTQNLGAGILANGASPTLRDNRIVHNVCDGTGYPTNYGGGISVMGFGYPGPLIVGNVIESNELRNGSWSRGAGIYVHITGRAEIVGNTIRGNKNRGGAAATGGAAGGGIYADGASVLVASNLIVQNENTAPVWNYGGGVFANLVLGGTVTIVNNTLVANTCLGGIWNSGAGLYADAQSSGGTLVIAGNIVAQNVGGGLHSASSLTTALTLDWNDVWQNTGGDYVGFTRGTHDIAVDPMFASATSYDLAPSSPLIDAMPATHLPASVGIDYQGGARRSDGNADGIAGNGARLDFGADELSPSVLTLSAPLRLGSAPALRVTAGKPSLFGVYLDLAEGNHLLEPVGNVLLSFDLVFLTGGTTPGSVPLPLPNVSGWAGTTVWFQAITTPLANPSVGATTNSIAATLF